MHEHKKKTKTKEPKKKTLFSLQIHILHVATFYEHYKAINEYSYSTIHIKPELIQYTR